MEFNLGEVNERIGAAIPDRECIVFDGLRLTWGQVAERTRRLANVLHRAGLGAHTERDTLASYESGQDRLAIYLRNGNEYLETMLGAFKARVAPFNANFRYVAEELRYLLIDSGATAVVFHSEFAPTLAAVLDDLPARPLLLQVADGSGTPLLAGARWYEEALAEAPATQPPVAPSPDDLYILYTGGTTGMPKGVLWRQADIFVEALGGRRADRSEYETYEQLVADAVAGSLRALPAPPFMHGAGHWIAFTTFHRGGTVFIPPASDRFDPEALWAMVERERVSFLLIVGDAFAQPLLDVLDAGAARRDLSCLTVLLSGGAPLAAPLKRRFLEHLPQLVIVDGLGASEVGGQMQHVSTGGRVSTGVFTPGPSSCVLSADLSRVLSPGDPEIGWLAKSGRLALGYLGDPEKTATTYRLVGGERYGVPGDRARALDDGSIELHGRDSVTINSGGEKIFAEEVEHALRYHHDVYDCVVAGRPHDRWGSEVVAVVQLRAGATPDEDALLATAVQHIARYKLPKAFVFVDRIVRSPAGKADYRWARAIAEAGA